METLSNIGQAAYKNFGSIYSYTYGKAQEAKQNLIDFCNSDGFRKYKESGTLLLTAIPATAATYLLFTLGTDQKIIGGNPDIFKNGNDYIDPTIFACTFSAATPVAAAITNFIKEYNQEKKNEEKSKAEMKAIK